MRIFVVGATGFVGNAVAVHLLTEGHEVHGLARTPVAAAGLRSQGVVPLVGDLQGGLPAVVAEASTAEVVVYAAQLGPEEEVEVVTAFLEACEAARSTFVLTSGSGVLLQRTAGSWSPDSFAEDDDFTVEPLAARRKHVEDLVRGCVDRGVRAMVVRPGMIWGPGDHGHVPMTYRGVATLGAAGYVGEGLNVYSHVHVDDVARLFSLVIARGASGGLYHAVAGETPTRWIAEAVGRDLGVPVRSLTTEEAAAVWGELDGLIAGATSRLRDPRSRALGWAPSRTDLLESIGDPRRRSLAQPG